MEFTGFFIDRKNLLSEMKIFAYKKGSSFGIRPIIPTALSNSVNEESTPMISNTSFVENNQSFYFDMKKQKTAFTLKLNQTKSKIANKLKITFDNKIQNDEEIEKALSNCYSLIKVFEGDIKNHQVHFTSKLKPNTLAERIDSAMMSHLNTEFSKMIKTLKKEEQKYFGGIRQKKQQNDVSFFDFIHDEKYDQDQQIIYGENGSKMMLTEINQNQSSAQLTKMLDQINSLTDMLSQIHDMAIEQGTVIDRIDMHLEMTLDRTQKGNKELLIVKEELEKGCAARLLKYLIVANIVVFLLLMLKFR